MDGAMRRVGGAFAHGAGMVALALGLAACGAVQNMMPDPADFHLPDTRNFRPTNVQAYAPPVSASGAVGAAELVDARGACPDIAPTVASGDALPGIGGPGVPATPNGVALEMTECQVARALGPPQQAEIGATPRGVRTAVLTYVTGDRAGIYRFVNGRLTAIERGAEAEPPPVAKKPPPKKPKPPAPPPA